MKQILPIICFGLLAAGCASPGSNIKWYNPATYFSGKAGRAAERAQSRVGEKKVQALGAAQAAAHKAQAAIAKIPSGIEQAVAADFAGEVVVLLDQVVGAPKFGDLTAWQQQVDRLCSSDAAVRAKAELERAEQRAETAKLSRKLQDAEAASVERTSDLQEAFKRENALANELRNQRWWKWFILISVGTVALLASGAYVYVRYFFGGLPGGILKRVVPLLDRLYDNGTPETQQWLQSHIFDQLSEGDYKMTLAQRKAVHRIRAAAS